MKRMRLLTVLLAMCFFTAVVSAGGNEAQPQVDTIDIHEAVRMAEGLLLNEPHYADYYANRELVISDVEKHDTQCNFLLVHSNSKVRLCKDMQAGEFLQLHPEDVYSEYIFEKLEDRTYWLVYFAPAGAVLGGDIAFFIDVESSELIHVYRGK